MEPAEIVHHQGLDATGAIIGDPAGHDVMARVAADENLHHLFYRDLATAAFAVAPDQMM
ncbi:MAG: acyl-ACP desaturase, partial [Coraliomargarita sp.]